MIRVRKADGRLEPYDGSKIMRTALYLGLDREDAERIEREVLEKAYDGIPTSEILAMIRDLAEEIRPELSQARDIREAISAMRPKPDFEDYARIVLREAGYLVEPGRLLEGRCVSHEIDGIAFKGDEVFVVEVKHHFNQHAYTGLGTVLELWAALEDLREGYRLGFHPYAFTSAILVCNTKISQHAEQYARCKGIMYMGWRYPRAFALSDIVSSKKIYPITMIKSLSAEAVAKLGDRGIVTLNQLLRLKADEIASIMGASLEEADRLREIAEKIISSPRQT
ncbi:MAG: restriction endonuclease [Nitrososphaerota archaeon]